MVKLPSIRYVAISFPGKHITAAITNDMDNPKRYMLLENVDIRVRVCRCTPPANKQPKQAQGLPNAKAAISSDSRYIIKQ
jgi:hypothetical protein